MNQNRSEENQIDPIQHERIHNAMASAFPNEPWEILESVGGGLSTSLIYKINVRGDNYVVRLSDPDHPHNNLPAEYEAMKLAAEQNLAPTLYHANAQTGITISDFIEGEPLNAMDPDNHTFRSTLAHTVRTLHQGKPFQKGMRLTEKVEFLLGQMRADLAATELVQQGISKMRELAPLLTDPTDDRPCHCDINPGNLLFDGSQLWLIDWAAAAQENFYFDLATCSNFFFFTNREVERAFLEEYFQRPLSDEENEKYTRMRTFVAIYYGIMFIYLSGVQGASLLSSQEIDDLPTYPQFLAMVGQGEKRMDDPTAQQRLGFVYLKMV